MDGGLSLIFSRAGTLSRPAACTIFIGTRRGPRRRTSCVPLNQSLAPKTCFYFQQQKSKSHMVKNSASPPKKNPPRNSLCCHRPSVFPPCGTIAFSSFLLRCVTEATEEGGTIWGNQVGFFLARRKHDVVVCCYRRLISCN